MEQHHLAEEHEHDDESEGGEDNVWNQVRTTMSCLSVYLSAMMYRMSGWPGLAQLFTVGSIDFLGTPLITPGTTDVAFHFFNHRCFSFFQSSTSAGD